MATDMLGHELQTLVEFGLAAAARERPYPTLKLPTPLPSTPAAPSITPRSRLLALPDELLLHIWNFSTDLSRHPVQEPDLLRTCRTLRGKLLPEWLKKLREHFTALQQQRRDYLGQPVYTRIFASRSYRTYKEIFKVERQSGEVRVAEMSLVGEWEGKYLGEKTIEVLKKFVEREVGRDVLWSAMRGVAKEV